MILLILKLEPCFLLQTISDLGFRVKGVAGVGENLTWDMALKLGLKAVKEGQRKVLQLEKVA